MTTMESKAQECLFRLTFIKEYFKSIIEFFDNVDEMDVRQCCAGCKHQCTSCKTECVNKPDCHHLPCTECGKAAKNCFYNRAFKTTAVMTAVKEIKAKDCQNFVEGEPFKNFPHCKTLSLIFENYIHEEIDFWSSYLLMKRTINLEEHKDNLMYARMLHRLPLTQLKCFFKEIDLEAVIQHQNEPMEDEDDSDEEDNEVPDKNDASSNTKLTEKEANLYRLTKKDMLKDWQVEDLRRLMMQKKYRKIKALFSHEPYLKELADEDEHTVLTKCVLANDCPGLSFLIMEQFDITEIMLEVGRHGSIDLLKLVLEYKPAAFNYKSVLGITPLHVACAFGNSDVVKYLLQLDGIELNAKSEDNESPLYLAWEYEHAEIIELLLQKDSIQSNIEEVCDISSKMKNTTLLHWACALNHTEIVRLLIQKHRRDINKETHGQYSPLVSSYLNGHFRLVQFLLTQDKIDINVKVPGDEYFIHKACSDNQIEIVELLLNNTSTCVDITDGEHKNALHVACENAHIAIIDKLLEREDIDVNAETDCRDTPLHFACRAKSSKAVAMLLKIKSVNVNIKNSSNNLPDANVCDDHVIKKMVKEARESAK